MNDGAVWALCGIILLLDAIATIALARVSYYNGVVDGYGYAKEPSRPRYRRAGDCLRKYMGHRWPEITDNSFDVLDAIVKARAEKTEKEITGGAK